MALTSHLIKVFERVVRLALVAHIEQHNLLPDGQHGSRAMRSTLTQLMAHWDSILDGLIAGTGVDCIYLDFSKAFDKVETGVLLHKLKESKVLGKLGVWLGKFLEEFPKEQYLGPYCFYFTYHALQEKYQLKQKSQAMLMILELTAA